MIWGFGNVVLEYSEIGIRIHKKFVKLKGVNFVYKFLAGNLNFPSDFIKVNKFKIRRESQIYEFKVLNIFEALFLAGNLNFPFRFSKSKQIQNKTRKGNSNL